MIPSDCVFLCSRCGRTNKSLVLFYEYIFKLEAPHFNRLLEGKQAQLEIKRKAYYALAAANEPPI